MDRKIVDVSTLREYNNKKVLESIYENMPIIFEQGRSYNEKFSTNVSNIVDTVVQAIDHNPDSDMIRLSFNILFYLFQEIESFDSEKYAEIDGLVYSSGASSDCATLRIKCLQLFTAINNAKERLEYI